MGLKRDLVGLSRLRIALITVLGVILLIAVAGSAAAATSSDPNHKGWTGKYPKLKQVDWKPVATKCKDCVQITEQYNQTIQQLLKHRYWVKFWREVQKNREKGKKDPFWPGKGDINDFESKAVAANLELMDLQNAQLELHKKAIFVHEQQASYLAQAIKDCEQTQCPDEKKTKQKKIKIGGETSKTTFQPDVAGILRQHDIDWQGPYTSDCLPCLEFVEQLNALPGWVVRVHMKLQRAESMLKYSEFINQSNEVKVLFLQYKHPDKSDYNNLRNEIATLKAEIRALKQLFENLLEQREACRQKYCPLDKGISTCPDPSAGELITVGANADVGSRANFREKAKKKAAGLATKAITGLLGIGGGSGGKSDGPGTYKDPVKNKRKIKVKHKESKRDIRVGGVFTADGLLISSNIKKAPGKGTFQTVYMENLRGWRLLPIRLFMYEIWRDWKLNVSWTKDTYVNGEHVKHEQGGWSESWRELIEKGDVIEYAEIPIWEQLGFNTAVSGARSLGTLFPVSPSMLAKEPINLVVHITDPKKDPVVTFPYIFQVSLGDGGKIILEPVDDTPASGSPCEEAENQPPPVATDTPVDGPPPSDGPNVITPPPVPTSPEEQPKPQSCPPGWACKSGKQCPPIENCTLPDENTGPPSPIDDSSSVDDSIEEINITGSRIKRDRDDEPIVIDIEDLPTKPSSEDLEEIVVSTPRIKSLAELRYDNLRLGSGLKYDLDSENHTEHGSTETPPTIYGEEIEDPPIVGIVLKNSNRRWIPRHNNKTIVEAKMYVPDPSGGKSWIPHKSVARKMEITFIARSNEKGKAMNADLKTGPQDSPDLYFSTALNYNMDCKDDPTGNGHYGTCSTKTPQNEQTFTINSDDFGGFSRLDVSCEGCVQLTLVAGLFPRAFTPNQQWEIAVEEPDQEKRAVYVPHDMNRNQISDGYLPDRTDHPSPSDDDENIPVGNGNRGDGLSAYEEYRGFIDRWGFHQRTDWNKKSLLIENNNAATTSLFERASGVQVVEIDSSGHKERIINYNSGHANVVAQHGVLVQVSEAFADKYAGLCDGCDRERPKGAPRVLVKPKYKNKPTVAHEIGHAVGMSHHGEEDWPDEKESIRLMTSGWRDALPGRVHSNPQLCGKTLPASFMVSVKGDQASGNHLCIMRYNWEGYVYEQDGGDYDCMPAVSRTLFDSSSNGTGANGHNRTAGNASLGDCMSQLWINSK